MQPTHCSLYKCRWDVYYVPLVFCFIRSIVRKSHISIKNYQTTSATAGKRNVNYTAACLFSDLMSTPLNCTEELITGHWLRDYRSKGEIIVSFAYAGCSGRGKKTQKNSLLTKCNYQHWLTGSWNSVQFLIKCSKRSWHKQEIWIIKE